MGTLFFATLLIFFAVPVLIAAAVGDKVLRKGGNSADTRLFRTSLFWTLLYFLALPLFWIGDLGDPLWPNQDLNDEQWAEYEREHAHSTFFYGIGIAIMIIAFFCQAGMILRRFMIRRRPPRTRSDSNA